MREALLIHNPKAGEREHAKERLTELIEARGYRVRYQSAKEPGIEARFEEDGCDLIIIAGGDGTIARVAKLIAAPPEQPAPLAIIPTGTANNIALSLEFDDPVEDLIAAWDPKRTRKLAYGIAKGHWGEQIFIEGIGLGSLARATTPAEGTPKIRDQRIAAGRKALRDAIADMVPQRLYITVDEQRIEEEVLLVEILNIKQVGPRLRLAPAADAGDDLLDVAYVTAEQRHSFAVWLEALIEHELDGASAPPPIGIIQGKKIVTAWNGLELRIDDKFPLMPGQTSNARPEDAPKEFADMLTAEIVGRPLEVLATGKRKTAAKAAGGAKPGGKARAAKSTAAA
jgi:diacylglycerol kinase family enzyme